MAKRASEWIPHNILRAAEQAGLNVPLWYVGRTNGHVRHAREKTVKGLVEEIKREQQARHGTGPDAGSKAEADL